MANFRSCWNGTILCIWFPWCFVRQCRWCRRGCRCFTTCPCRACSTAKFNTIFHRPIWALDRLTRWTRCRGCALAALSVSADIVDACVATSHVLGTIWTFMVRAGLLTLATITSRATSFTNRASSGTLEETRRTFIVCTGVWCCRRRRCLASVCACAILTGPGLQQIDLFLSGTAHHP